jgi:hypothetical protein
MLLEAEELGEGEAQAETLGLPVPAPAPPPSLPCTEALPQAEPCAEEDSAPEALACAERVELGEGREEAVEE